ncbi:MAG: ATP-binding protein [Desulfamplus sp.]|nr:ATP-binding protein [Desulfamplus sp.]
MCDELISLDTYRHWFDDAETGSLPDLLRLVACIEADGIIHISAHLIECKFANHSEAHLEKAREQLELALNHLIPTFLPCRSSHQGRHDQRYWWGQLQRLIAGKSKIAHHEYQRVMTSLEKVLGGYYTIQWYASAVVFWKDKIGDKFVVDEQWPYDFDHKYMEMEVVSCGNDLIHTLCCDDGINAAIPLPGTSMSYRFDDDDEEMFDTTDETTGDDIILSSGLGLNGLDCDFTSPKDENFVSVSTINDEDDSVNEEYNKTSATTDNESSKSFVHKKFYVNFGDSDKSGDSTSTENTAVVRQIDDGEDKSATNEYNTSKLEDPIEVSDIIEVSPSVGENESNFPSRVFLGNAINHETLTNKKIYWEFGHPQLTNRHFLIFGQSGAGKTYAIQSILYELSQQNQNSIIVDYTNGFESSQLEEEIKTSVNPKQHLVSQIPLPINPFRKQYTVIDGKEYPEKDTNTAMRIVSVFDSVYNLGEQQIAALYNAIMEGFKEYKAKLNLEILSDILKGNASEKGTGKESAASLLNKIIPFVHQEPFRDELPEGWNAFYKDQDHKLHIIQLAGCSKIISRLITEFVLVDFYWYSRSFGNKNDPKVIVLDEIQNLDHKLESPLGSFLTEGRKFGISSILATQTLSNLQADQKDRLFQSAHKLFFKPAETEVQEYSKILEKVTNESQKVWSQRLTQLKKGQCYSIGPFLNKKTGTLHDNKPYRIQITALPERIKGNYYD